MSLLSRFLGRGDDPADMMIDWLSTRSPDDRILAAGRLFGGPHSLKVWKWVLSRTDCDLGTAAMLLWTFGAPHTLVAGPDRLATADRVKRELIDFTTERWRRIPFLPAVFAFDPRESTKVYRRELKKNGMQGSDPFHIPEEAWQPIAGRKPERGPELVPTRENRFGALLGQLRLADLAAAKPDEWEPVQRRSRGIG